MLLKGADIGVASRNETGVDVNRSSTSNPHVSMQTPFPWDKSTKVKFVI